MKPNTQQLNDLTIQVRRDILRMVHAVNSGHPGGSLGCTEFLVALYQNLMERKEGFDMDGIGEDLFFLSNGHISPVFYSVLARSGYFPVAELATFRLINCRLQGHPTTHDGLPGIRMASGSLGQGLSVGIGAAQAKKLNNDKHLVYTLHGDGELQEGQNWEAIIAGMNDAKSRTGKGKPVCVLLHTEMGNGVDFMMHTHAWHGKAPNDAQLEQALAQNTSTLADY